eukprot:SAG31_NODE_1243_length_9148_cov_8.476738_6_plen_99_part_00
MVCHQLHASAYAESSDSLDVLLGIMYGMLTASLASLLVQMSASRQRFMERMECVRDWLSMRQISASLRNDVYDFFVAKYSSEKIFDEQVSVRTYSIWL